MSNKIAISLITMLLLCGCGSKKEGKNDAKANAPATSSNKTFYVEVAPVKRQDVVYTITAIGSLEAVEDIQIPARVSGAAENVNFNENDIVDENTVLLEVDPATYDMLANQAKAAYEKATAVLHQAQSDLDRRIALKKIDAGWVSDEDITSYTAQVETATASLHEAKATWDLAELNKKYSRVTAPRKGIIDKKFVTTGQYLKPDQIVATMENLSKLRLRFSVSETESIMLSAGMSCNFVAKPLPQKHFTATIYHVGQVADPSTRMVECVAWADNAQEILKPGFFAEISIDARTDKGAIVAPESAISPTEKGFVAFVVEKSVAKEHILHLGLHTKDGKVEVLSGLKEGETLITRGGNFLSDGANVEIVK